MCCCSGVLDVPIYNYNPPPCKQRFRGYIGITLSVLSVGLSIFLVSTILYIVRYDYKIKSQTNTCIFIYLCMYLFSDRKQIGHLY